MRAERSNTVRSRMVLSLNIHDVSLSAWHNSARRRCRKASNDATLLLVDGLGVVIAVMRLIVALSDSV